MAENQTSSSPSGQQQQRAASPLRPLAPASLNFVFGQNLEDRVILPANTTTAGADEDKKEEEPEAQPSTSTSTSSSNASAAVAEEKAVIECGTDNGTRTVIAPAIGAGAAAAKDAAAVIQKRKFEATIVTGEEDESNVLQIHCKLYHWETDDSVWKEKGKGFLKLNDKKSRDDRLSSRLIMRTSGTLNVILNCSLVPGMNFSKSSDTSLKFTNFEGIFSVKGKEKEIELLHDAIECRMREMAKKVKSDGQSASAAAAALSGPPITPVTKSPPAAVIIKPATTASSCHTSSSPASSSPSSSSNSSSSSSPNSSASPSASLSSDPSLIVKPATGSLDHNGPNIAATAAADENGPKVNPEENGLKPVTEADEQAARVREVASND